MKFIGNAYTVNRILVNSEFPWWRLKNWKLQKKEFVLSSQTLQEWKKNDYDKNKKLEEDCVAAVFQLEGSACLPT